MPSRKDHELCLYAYHFTGDYDESKDIVQNVFLNLWRKRHKLEKVDSIKNFLYRAVYNGFLNYYRNKRRFTRFEYEEMIAIHDVVNNEDDEILKKHLILIKREIEKLPPKCKHVFLLSKQEGLTNVEIAKFLNISKKTVENHITKAFNLLSKSVESEVSIFYFLLFNLNSNDGL